MKLHCSLTWSFLAVDVVMWTRAQPKQFWGRKCGSRYGYRTSMCLYRMYRCSCHLRRSCPGCGPVAIPGIPACILCTIGHCNSKNHKFKEQILSIVRKYGYQISRPKVKYYTKLYPKLVTGVVIDSSGSPIINNAMREKIINEHRHLRVFPDDKSSRQRLCGLLTAASHVDPHAFPTIYKFAFSSGENPRASTSFITSLCFCAG